MIPFKYILYIITIFCVSCANETKMDRTLLIQNQLEQKKQYYLNEVLQTCRKDMILKAETYVDSLISEQISFILSDSIFFPEKPLKPVFTGPIIVSDTLKAKTIFDVDSIH